MLPGVRSAIGTLSTTLSIVPGVVTAWKQPIDQYDAYKLKNPFNGLPDQVTHKGFTWKVTGADGAGNNVWEPGVFGWTKV